jgi:cytochrome d ubiquinol oxidase subunit I
MLGILFRKDLAKRRWFLWFSVYSILFPYIANLAGWFTAECGRQPWIVQGVLRTSEGVSRVISRSDVIASLIMFTFMYILMGVLFVFLLNKKIQKGPIFDDVNDNSNTYRDPFLELNK